MPPRRKAPRGRVPPRRSTLARILRTILLVLVVAGVTGLGTLAWLWPRCSGAACPSVAALRDYSPPQASRIFDREGQLVAHLAPERRILVSLGELPPHLIGAFLAVEDKRFYRHHGVDYRRVAGALARNLRTLRYRQGFSTITMQLARNVFPEHLSREKTLARKLWEVMLARDIERAFSKDEILEMYLNQIYLGEGFYGVEAAARGYFGKPASEVLQSEAALLAALPRAPSYYNPRRNPPAALGRRNLVLGLMAAEKVISPELAERARAAPLRLAPPPEALGRAPYFVAAVRRELTERFGVDADRAGLRVYTTLDPGMQAAAERELVARIRAVEAGQFGPFRGKSCASGEAAAPSACLQGLFVAMSTRTGDVLALVGGRDFALSQFDRATQAKRQAGSAFKPVVYATALAEGIPISTALVGPGATFASYPAGYNPADHVSDTLTLDMRGALRLSSNRAAVSLGERVGVSRVVQTARDLGITTPIGAYPSTFLGAAEVIPLEMVAAFTAFAADGVRATPRLIRNVEDGRGRTIWEAPIERHRALSPGVAYLTTTLMEEVVDRGTGSGVRSAGLPWDIPAAGKTGTTDDAADVWFVGVTPDVAAGVWMGFDRPRRILRNASGGGLAAPVWGEVMKDYYRSRPPPMRWTPPAELVRVEIDQRSGMLATRACPPDEVVAEWYLPGTEPLEYCPLHPDDFGGWLDRMTRGLSGWFGGKDTRP